MPSRCQPFHDLQQRHVGFGDGLEEPAFLQKLFVLRMPHERQVRVEDEREIALHGPEQLIRRACPKPIPRRPWP